MRVLFLEMTGNDFPNTPRMTLEMNTLSSGFTFRLPFQTMMSIYPAFAFLPSKIETAHVGKKLLFA